MMSWLCKVLTQCREVLRVDTADKWTRSSRRHSCLSLPVSKSHTNFGYSMLYSGPSFHRDCVLVLLCSPCCCFVLMLHRSISIKYNSYLFCFTWNIVTSQHRLYTAVCIHVCGTNMEQLPAEVTSSNSLQTFKILIYSWRRFHSF